VLTKMMN